MTLSFPVLVTVEDATYNILTPMIHSVSDAANKIVAMNNANVQFSDILNRWATETGTITVTLPDGTKQQLRTGKEMDKQLGGKFEKAGGVVDGSLTSAGNITSKGDVIQVLNSKNGQLIQLDTTNDGLAKINSRQKGGTTLSHALPASSGTLMQVGDSGLGTINFNQAPGNGSSANLPSGFHAIPGDDAYKIPGGGATNLIQTGGGVYSW